MDINHSVILLACDARSYYDAYEILREKRPQQVSIQSNEIQQRQNQANDHSGYLSPTTGNINLSSPALVCLAFSVELHVKLLLRTYDLNPWGHHIGKLMKQLPKDEMTCISTHPDFHPTQQGERFFENIDIASDLFIRTRYYFEKVGTLHFNTGFCLTLAMVIRKRIVERVPYLRHDLGVF